MEWTPASKGSSSGIKDELTSDGGTCMDRNGWDAGAVELRWLTSYQMRYGQPRAEGTCSGNQMESGPTEGEGAWGASLREASARCLLNVKTEMARKELECRSVSGERKIVGTVEPEEGRTVCAHQPHPGTWMCFSTVAPRQHRHPGPLVGYLDLLAAIYWAPTTYQLLLYI